MYLTPLGHTECLLEIPNKQGKIVTLLIDSWLSDVCVADMMARRERVRIDYQSAPHIDIIFLSHSHLDHFDPYTLSEIIQHHSPMILLPETCSFALPILKRYFKNIQIELLSSRVKKEIFGVEIEGVIWGTGTVSNEEDVMTIMISNQDTLVYHEIDTRLPFSEDDREYFEKKIKSHQGKSLLLIESGNEIESHLRMLDTKRPGERNEISKEVGELFADRLREEWQYLHDYELYDPRHEPRATRAWIGQGITTPREIHEKLASYHPLPLLELVKIESKTLKEYRLKPSTALLPGKRYEVLRNGGLKEIPSLKGIKVEPYNTHNEYRSIPFIERTGKSVFGSQLALKVPTDTILDILNHRFLPYGFALSSDPLKLAILSSYRHSYPIAICDENSNVIESYSYHFDIGQYTRDNTPIDRKNASEVYIITDIVDYLEGRQELYSSFVHKMEQGKFGRLWTAMGANFINIDLQTKKLTYHFERAIGGTKNHELTQELLKVYRRTVEIK